MKISRVEIRNFKSITEMDLWVGNIVTLVGANNVGKSNVLKALEVFFEGSTRLVDKACFHRENVNLPIEIVVTFGGLNDWEHDRLEPWLLNEDTLVVKKVFVWEGEKCTIRNYAVMQEPEVVWLRANEISGAHIAVWWEDRESLVVGGLSFGSCLGSSKPKVSEWKELAAAFVAQHAEEIPWSNTEVDNPTGWANVLKGTLPKFVFVRAVRDVIDETKMTKTNPFGLLMQWMLGGVGNADRDALKMRLGQVENLVNVSEAGERLEAISGLERELNQHLSEVVTGLQLEIEMTLPTVDELFGNARVYGDDGVRSAIETKGHGMQRAVIFTVLRAGAVMVREAEQSDNGAAGGRQSLIFAIEEPELYLHPQSQRSFRKVLWEIGDGESQVFYTTHSSLLVDVSRFDDLCIVRRGEDCATSVQRVSMEDMIDDLEKRRDICGTAQGMRDLYSRAFSSSVNEGFFTGTVVIVEGPSEEYALPLYAQAAGYDLDANDVGVVQCEGKGRMDRLWRLFEFFGIRTYLVFDGDKSNADSERRRETLELLELVGEPVSTIEDLETTVAERYAVFEETFDAVIEAEVEGYEGLMNVCEESIGPSGPRSKPLRHRFVARELLQKVEAGEKSPEEAIPGTVLSIVRAVESMQE